MAEDGSAPAEIEPSPPRWRGALVAGAPFAAVAGAATVAFLALYRPWGTRFGAPWSYGDDNVAYASFVRTLQLEGDYGYAPSLGAPYGQELYDFPQGGNRMHHVAWRIIGSVVDDPFTVLNIWFALGFPLIALAAFWVLRRIGVRPLVAGALGVAYAFIPYRFWRGLQHVTLATYVAIPLVVLLTVWVMTDQLPRPRRWAGPGPWDRRGAIRRSVAIVLMAVVIGSSDPYYVVFGVILIGTAGVLELARSRRLAPLVGAVVVAGLLGFVLMVNLLPEIRFRMEHGPNERVTERLLAESEIYGLHPAQLLSPSPDHRVEPLAALGRRSAAVPMPGEGGTAVGLLGVAGLVVGAGAVLSLRRASDERRLLLQRIGSLQLVMVLVATVGGLGFLLAVAGFTQIRSWARLSVLIAFLAFAALGLAAVPVLDRATSVRSRRMVSAGVVLVGLLGVLDGTPGAVKPNYALARALEQDDRAFVADMEAGLPEGSMVFQLPVIPFPETPMPDMGSYDHFRPYIFGEDRLRWSFGGLKGRVHDWQEVWANEPMVRQLQGIAAAGFAAVYVDTAGFAPDRTAELEQVLGEPTGVSGDGRERWYDLRPFAADVRAELGADNAESLGAAVITAVRTELVGGATADEATLDGAGQWVPREARVVFPNFGAEGRPMIIRFQAVGPAGAVLRAVGPGVDESIVLTGAPDQVELRVELPEGSSELVLSTAGPDTGGAERLVHLTKVRAVDAVVEEILGRP